MSSYCVTIVSGTFLISSNLGKVYFHIFTILIVIFAYG